MLDAHVTGARIRQMRLCNRLDQAELAVRAGLEQQSTISRLENGRMLPDEPMLVALSRALDCSPPFLSDPVELAPATRPWLRAYADAPKRVVDQQLADCTTAVEVIERLSLRTIPDTVPAFDGDPDDDQAIEEFALVVREAAGIPEGSAVGHAVRAAERLGCLVLPMEEELGRHLGMSTFVDMRPVICIARPSSAQPHPIPGDRQRHTLAHELGHLGLHRGLPPPADAATAQRIERQAHRFAGAFLTPADALVEELDDVGGRVTLSSLAVIKGRWGVAIKALVLRFKQLGVIDEDHARSLYKQISARKWNKQEPVEVPNEGAVWLRRALEKASRPQGQQPLEIASSGVGHTHLTRWTTWEPIEERQAVVLDLPRPTPAAGRPGPAAPVTSLTTYRTT